MLDSLALDAPQTLPQIPRIPQAPEWYERQQVAGSLPRIAFDARGLGGSLLSQNCPYEQIRANRDLAAQLRTLQQHYVILGSGRLVTELLEEESALFALLVEAVQPLRTAFGERRLLQVRVQHSDDDSLLRVAVQLPAVFGDDPERALRSFDREWWLNNCHRSGGALVFDYEIQDAV